MRDLAKRPEQRNASLTGMVHMVEQAEYDSEVMLSYSQSKAEDKQQLEDTDTVMTELVKTSSLLDSGT